MNWDSLRAPQSGGMDTGTLRAIGDKITEDFTREVVKVIGTPPEPQLPGYQEFTIPKKNGKARKICAPNAALKRIQSLALKEMYQYYNEGAKFRGVEHIVHGFIPGKNVVTAAEKHVGYGMTVMMDISDFFDTVHKNMLPEKYHIDDYFHAEGYCAQGFVTSPILACIATLDMVSLIEMKLMREFGDGFVFTMYADDIQISTVGSDSDNIKKIVDIVRACVEGAGFKLNEKKTRTRYAKFGYRRILGINVGKDHYRATRKTMRKIRAARHGGNKSSLGGLTNWSNCPRPKTKK